MAILDPSSPLAAVRGRVGANVVSSNATSGYVKAFVPPTLKRTPAQQEQRLLFSQLSQNYGNLGVTDKALWKAAAALPQWQRTDWFGNPYTLTGQQLYLSVNSDRRRVGAFDLSQPPLSSTPAAPPTVTGILQYQGSGAPSLLSLNPPFPADAAYVFVDVQPRLGAWPEQPNGPLSPFYAFTSGGATSVDITSLLNERVGYVPFSFFLMARVYSVTADCVRGPAQSYVWWTGYWI